MSTTQPAAGPAGALVARVHRREAAENAGSGVEPPEPAGRRGRDRPGVALAYTPGFDGIRGGALVLMLLGHHGWSAAPGAMFTVSMFFTLSGFLIATLMLAEWARAGRVSLARFWERRARRLLPAAFVAVAGVVLLQHLFGLGSSPRFRGDVLSALTYTTNWRMASSGTDYAATFSMESPVQHYWSLALEEQFYLAFPLAFVALTWLTRGRWRLVGLAFGLGAAASFAAAWVSSVRSGNLGITYYATYTRVSEILAGVSLAFVMATPLVQRFLASRRGGLAANWMGVVGLAGFAWLIFDVGLDDPFAFRGGTLLNALFVCMVIVACVAPRPGVVARGLGVSPLVSLGKVTYTVYLIHLPIFLLLDQQRTGLGFWPLFALRIAVVVPLVLVSYHLIESPFRFRFRMPPPRLAVVAATPLALLAVVTMVVPVRASQTIDLTEAGAGDRPLVPDVVVPAGGTEPAARVLLIGDSVTWTMFSGLERWNLDNPDRQIHVDSHYAVACTLAEAGPVRSLGRIEEPYESCRHLRTALPATLARADYDAILVTLGGKDLSDRLVEGDWRHLGDPVFDEWLRPQIGDLADLVAAEGAPVLWSTISHVRIAQANDPTSDWRDYPDNDPARVDRINELIAEEIAGRPGFSILPADEWMHTIEGGEFNPAFRADGVHYTVMGSERFAAWLVPQILDVVPQR
ncbi:MAG TPA: acyltransferase family protein [Acidimicrobiales bacterium]